MAFTARGDIGGGDTLSVSCHMEPLPAKIDVHLDRAGFLVG